MRNVGGKNGNTSATKQHLATDFDFSRLTHYSSNGSGGVQGRGAEVHPVGFSWVAAWQDGLGGQGRS